MTDIDTNILNEALCPELSTTEFSLCGQTVKIQPLKVKYLMKFTKELAPALLQLSFDGTQFGALTALASSVQHLDTAYKLVYVIAENSGCTFTFDDLLESTHQPGEVTAILLAYAQKNDEVGRPVADFFLSVWPVLRDTLGESLQKAKKTILAQLHAVSGQG